MRFKYYLKGLGMGIIFTTLIMTVSSVIHNNNLPDEEVIERAMELGMVMPDSEKKSENGLFGNKDDSESESDSETESDPKTEDSEIPSETVTETQMSSETESEPTTEEPETQTPPTQVEITQYVLHITWGDTPKMIAKELEENGIIEDWSDFRDYISDNGYAGKIRSGSYTITAGMSYEEIAKIITKS